MKANLGVLVVGIGLLAPALPVLAHHSFAAEYDVKHPVTVKGVVTKVAWLNPHAHLFVTSKNEDGTTVSWAFEIASPNSLERRGWTRHSVKEGDQVTIEGYLAKDGEKLTDGSGHASARSVMLSDGRKIFSSSSADDGGPAAK
jgi:Family of unknown function (DUF6152)